MSGCRANRRNNEPEALIWPLTHRGRVAPPTWWALQKYRAASACGASTTAANTLGHQGEGAPDAALPPAPRLSWRPASTWGRVPTRAVGARQPPGAAPGSAPHSAWAPTPRGRDSRGSRGSRNRSSLWGAALRAARVPTTGNCQARTARAVLAESTALGDPLPLQKGPWAHE
jgi:hypothetical protein